MVLVNSATILMGILTAAVAVIMVFSKQLTGIILKPMGTSKRLF